MTLAKTKVMIVCWELGQLTESFISQQVNRLPCDVSVFEWNKKDEQATQSSSRFARWRRSEAPPSRANRFLQAIQESGSEVVLAETGILGAAIAKAIPTLPVPLVTQFFGVDAYAPRHIGDQGEKYLDLFSQSSALVCVSQDMVDQLVRLGADQNHTHYIQSFVDPSEFTVGKVKDTPPNFLAIHRFVEKKAPILTLMAFAQVAAQVPNATLTMVGDGPLMPACRQFVKVSNLCDQVKFVGSVGHDDLTGFMHQARCYVQHSVVASDNDHEGTPVVILEAQLSGLPVVSTRHAGICDVVSEGNTGYLVEEYDVDTMATHMLTLAKDSELASKLGLAGRETISKKFSFDNTLGRLADVLATAAQATPAGH